MRIKIFKESQYSDDVEYVDKQMTCSVIKQCHITKRAHLKMEEDVNAFLRMVNNPTVSYVGDKYVIVCITYTEEAGYRENAK